MNTTTENPKLSDETKGASIVGISDLLAAARDALGVARKTIQIFHGPVAWWDYQDSPEMTKINNTLHQLDVAIIKSKAANVES